ncbi:MAG: agmatinase [Candidatus Pseudothioglobus sp.]|jgi:agmatinase
MSTTDPRDRFIDRPLGGNTFAGELSFLRRLYTKDIAGADVVVSGIPFDSATTFRPGARLGPQAIRAASVQLAELLGRAFPFGINPAKVLAIADYGDCYLDSGYPQHVVEKVEAHAKKILASGALMVTFGGDHFVTYPILRAHAEKYGPVALVHFDAHVDTWEDDGERLDHGSMFLRAKREGLIDVSHSVQIGIRSYSDETHGFTVIDAPQVHVQSQQQTIQQILEVVGDHPAYLTFDIDCLDPAFAPGTGTPVAGGLSSAQALGIIRGLGSLNFIGMDVVEVAPAYDHAEITAIAAATIAHDFIGLLAQKKLARDGA